MEKNNGIFLTGKVWKKLLVLTIIVPEFDLGMSFGKVKSGKSLEKICKFIFKIT